MRLELPLLHPPLQVRSEGSRLAERSTATAQERPELGRNLTYGLLEFLGRGIVTGRFDDAPFPIEAELVRRYGVSLTVTREAVKMLCAKGLLTSRPRQGTTILPTSSWNLFDPDVLRWLVERKLEIGLLRQFNQLRAAIEPEGAALAARFASADHLAAIAQALARIEAAKAGWDDPVAAGIAFHISILYATQNPFYAQFRDVVGSALQTSIRFGASFHDSATNVADYHAVYEAIRAADADRARGAMRLLIDRVLGCIERADRR
ncbi:MAG TPA: FCD domain-containing protein [Sphingopyxis sp.]|nr:FCD domain-containing protein [Sphingopyxis sp.]